MQQNDPPGDDDTSGYNRRSILTGAGSVSVGGLLASTGLVSADDRDDGRDPGPKKDEILIGVSPSVSDIDREIGPQIPGDAGIEHTNETIHYAVVSLPEELPESARESLIETLTNIDQIEYAEENATLEALGTPNDPYYSSQHAPQQVNCETAWETTYGSDDVTISIVDQGIQYDHPVLEDHMDDSVSNHGREFVSGGSDPYPIAGDERHGTHVGGIAGGGTNNGTGHAGISNCSLLSARALNRQGRGSLSDIADAVQWSVDAGADVINLSLGSSSDYRTLRSACRYAVDNDVLVVAAAGNSGSYGVAYPAAYDDVVAVSALTASNSLASFSNRGSQIDLAAPGTRLISAVPWDSYTRMSGTSMAAPVVAGVAGLVLSAYPGLSGGEVREHLQSTAVDVGLSSNAQGYGRVDAGEAVTTVPEGYDGDERDGEEDDGEEDDDNELEERLLAFITEPDASNAGYEFTAEDTVEFTEAPYDSPSGRSIEGGTYTAEDFIDEEGETVRAGGVTGGGYGDAFTVSGPVTSIDLDQPDVMWIELDREELSPEEVIDETGGDPDEPDEEEPDEDEPDEEEPDEDEPDEEEPDEDEPDEDEPDEDEPDEDEPDEDEPDEEEPNDDQPDEDEPDDDDEEPSCGNETASERFDGELDAGWTGDSDRYTYSLRTDDPCSATLTLEGPSDADFDLYVTANGLPPSKWIHDESSTGSGASEEVSLELSGDEEIRVRVDADSGSGEYELRIDERGR
ncbi:S8 family peptidase [Natronorubrum tibetense]|uniref:Thermitase n=1 Tax=Natronorubrum tibetense GA33 TaxID=1114856 RepID=L9W961_9EURY|nr:S8 family serine peptidase [Natronorubrum tibetense]ELY45995.1 Thermitase [Natronorubrum tibetense GA33]